MSTDIYAIVFKGDIVEGFETAAVKAQMARLLKADAKKIAALFSGKPIVLKKTDDKSIAAKYGKALKQVGADVKVRIVKAEAKTAPAQQPAAVPPQAAEENSRPVRRRRKAAPVAEATTEEARVIDTSAISLASNEGNIVEPAPEVPAPDLDLSGISIAENDGTPLVEPSEEVVVELDLSEFSIAENDGSLIIEPAPEPPKVDAPDFGLDEPGAILETLQEEKEQLNPSTTGMTLAMTGSEMLEPEEREPEPPPVSPDTSKINLVANFDI
jgi:hypothetical protein